MLSAYSDVHMKIIHAEGKKMSTMWEEAEGERRKVGLRVEHFALQWQEVDMSGDSWRVNLGCDQFEECLHECSLQHLVQHIANRFRIRRTIQKSKYMYLVIVSMFATTIIYLKLPTVPAFFKLLNSNVSLSMQVDNELSPQVVKCEASSFMSNILCVFLWCFCLI